MTSSDFQICDKDREVTAGDIRVCDETKPLSGDVRICEACSGASTLALSGDDDVGVGDVFVTSGGLGPYSYAFTGGDISAEGEITALDNCGAAGSSRAGTVTVTDRCGNSASKTVRLSGGTWGNAEQYSATCGGIPCGDNYYLVPPYKIYFCAGELSYKNCIEISGSRRIETYFGCAYPNAQAEIGGDVASNCGCECANSNQSVAAWTTRIEHWVCP